MAGTWTAVPLAPFSFNSTPTTGSFYPGPAAPASFGYATSGTSTITAPTAWGTAPNAVAVPNTGSVLLWYWCGATGAGITQVLVGEQVAGQVLPATTAMTLAANSSGWIGPLSPAVYNIQNVATVPASSIVTGAMPAAYAGCFVVSFTTTTTLLVAAFSFSSVLP
jgi:hypothetical protein